MPTALIALLLLAQPCHISDAGGPDPICTPGETQAVDAEQLCTQRSSERRHVTAAMKRKVFVEYGLKPKQKLGAYEIDHFEPICLGGASTMANLWPQAAPAFHRKDKLEDDLCRMVCDGKISLDEAQSAILDWETAFALYETNAP